MNRAQLQQHRENLRHKIIKGMRLLLNHALVPDGKIKKDARRLLQKMERGALPTLGDCHHANALTDRANAASRVMSVQEVDNLRTHHEDPRDEPGVN